VLVCLLEVATFALVMMAALWLLEVHLLALRPGESVAQCKAIQEFTQMLQLSGILFLK
jgi:hypothetical protein